MNRHPFGPPPLPPAYPPGHQFNSGARVDVEQFPPQRHWPYNGEDVVHPDGPEQVGQHEPGFTHRDSPSMRKRASKSTGLDIQGGASGTIAEHWEPETDGVADACTLTAYIKAYDSAENAVSPGVVPTAAVLAASNGGDPYAGVDGTDAAPSGLLQTLEVLGDIFYGNDGVNRRVTCNLPAGATIKIPIMGSFARAGARLVPRYFKRLVVTAGHVYTYFVPAVDAATLQASLNERNNIFNAPNSPATSVNLGFTPIPIPAMPIHVDGIIGKGAPPIAQGSQTDRSSRSTRLFFGSVPATGDASVGDQVVHCPIAFGAAAIMLYSNPTTFVDLNGNTNAPLMFAMVDHAGNTVGSLQPNSFIPIMPDCQDIYVYNTGTQATENPFTLIFDLGF